MKLTGDDIEAAYYCAAREIRRRELRNEQVPSMIRTLYRRLDDAVRMSHSGRELSCATGQSDQDNWITARQVAELIGCCKKTVHRKRMELDGREIDGRWQFKLSTVMEHVEGMKSG